MASHGPNWLGIGAQRCGTTWFTDLLTQHPLVDVPDGVKEHNELYRYGLLAPWNEKAMKEYRQRFTHPELRFGEFSPYYMRAMWICDLTRETLPDDAPIIVMVRDPIDRFASGLRHMMLFSVRRYEKRLEAQLRGERETEKKLKLLPRKLSRVSDRARYRANYLKRLAVSTRPGQVLGTQELQDRTWMRYVGADTTWAGMYAAQLDAWVAAIPKDRFVFIQYEKMRRDPQYYVDIVWKRMGLDPVPLKATKKKSSSSSVSDLWLLDEHPHLIRALRAAYRPDAERLAREWDLDLSLWKRLMEDD